MIAFRSYCKSYNIQIELILNIQQLRLQQKQMQINRDSQTTFKIEQTLQEPLIKNITQDKNHQEQIKNINTLTKDEIKNNQLDNNDDPNSNNQIQILSQQKPTTRLDSLDVYRGLTMVGMILVDNSGPYPPWWLDHAQWNGLTPADLIFPSFLFIMGMAIPLSSTQKKPVSLKNLIRIIALFLIGVFLNLLARKFTFNHFRILGILQRLSICYAAILILHFLTNYGQVRRRFLGFLGILSGFLIYISYMVTFNHPQISCGAQKYLQQYCNFSGWVDRAIFGEMHMIYPNDPEGLFSNLSALFTTYMGYYFCLIMKDHKDKIKTTLKKWTIIVFILGITVYPMTKLMPLNKKIYSSSFALLTSASSGATILLMVLLVDILPSKNQKAKKIIGLVSKPFIWLGRNPLFVFVFMDLLAIVMIKLIIVNDKSIWSWFYHYCFSWISNQSVASVVYSCFYLLLWTGSAAILYRMNIFIRL